MVARATSRRVAVTSIVLVASIAAISGCTTLPLPGAPDESLVVFLTDLPPGSWTMGGRSTHIVSADLHFVHADTRKESWVAVYPGRPYAVTALAPGSYLMSALNVILETGTGRDVARRENRLSLYGSFYVSARTVLLCMRGIRVRTSGKGCSVEYLLTIGQEHAEARKQIQEDLAGDRRWTAWEEYQLVNLEEAAQ